MGPKVVLVMYGPITLNWDIFSLKNELNDSKWVFNVIGLSQY